MHNGKAIEVYGILIEFFKRLVEDLYNLLCTIMTKYMKTEIFSTINTVNWDLLFDCMKKISKDKGLL